MKFEFCARGIFSPGLVKMVESLASLPDNLLPYSHREGWDIGMFIKIVPKVL